MSTTGSARRRIRGWSAVTLAALLVQNLLGIYVNLFVVLPSDPAGAQVFTWNLVLAIHAGVAFLLMGLFAVLTVVTWRLDHTALLASAVGLASVVLASGAGFAFVYRGQDNASSFLMEFFFAVAVAAGIVLVYLAGRSVRDELAVGRVS